MRYFFGICVGLGSFFGGGCFYVGLVLMLKSWYSILLQCYVFMIDVVCGCCFFGLLFDVKWVYVVMKRCLFLYQVVFFDVCI